MLATTFLLTTLASGLSVIAQNVINVAVGSTNGSLTYSPDNFNANPGDTVRFTFTAGNHTVTQSTFQSPCNASGFTSGFTPVAPGANPPTFDLLINDTTPIWGHCEQTNPVVHCAKGMVFGINPPTSGNTFALFRAHALAQDSSSASGSSASSTASGQFVNSASTTNTASTTGTSQAGSSTSSSPSSTGSAPASSQSGGAIGPITASASGIIVVAATILGLIW